MEIPISVSLRAHKYNGLDWAVEEVEVAAEYPLTIYLNNEELATIICTPDHLEEMVIGFLGSEGVIQSFSEIDTILLDTDHGTAYVDLNRAYIFDPLQFTKRKITSCCGKSRQSFYYETDEQAAKPIRSVAAITPLEAYALMNQLHETSTLHHATGGVHHAALCNKHGIEMQFTDIGRHNALDKIYGCCLSRNIDLSDKILVISGRISSEMLLKAVKIGVGILLSKSAPTDLAIRFAEDLGVTAVGFVRQHKMNVYSHSHRIITDVMPS